MIKVDRLVSITIEVEESDARKFRDDLNSVADRSQTTKDLVLLLNSTLGKDEKKPWV